jgi:hypothetical protein
LITAGDEFNSAGELRLRGQPTFSVGVVPVLQKFLVAKVLSCYWRRFQTLPI